jgi:multiple sugar transport system permease protein
MKNSYKIFIYIVVICGAILMLLPFAWMVDTSFKASSEVSTWPPKWTTKNAAQSYTFNTKIQKKTSGSGVDLTSLSLSEFKNFSALLSERTGDNILVLTLDDDPIRRGEVELLLLNNEDESAFYALNISEADIANFFNEFTSYEELPEEYSFIKDIETKNIDEFINEYLDSSEYSTTGFMRRIIFVSEIDGILNKIKTTLETSIYNPFKELPMDTEETKTIKINIKSKLEEETSEIIDLIGNTEEELLEFRKGEQAVLFREELLKITNMIGKIDSYIDGSFDNIFAYLNESIPEDDRFLNMAKSQFEKIYSGNLEKRLSEWSNLVNQYIFVKNFYSTQQINQIASIRITGKIRNNEEIYDSLVSKIDNWNVPEDIKNEILNRISVNNILNSNNIFLDLLDGKMIDKIRKLDEDYMDIFSDVNENLNLIKSSMYLLENENLKSEIENFLNGNGDNGNYEKLKELLSSLSNEVGQSFVYAALFSDFDYFASSFGSDNLMSIIYERWKQIDWIGEFSKLFSDSMGELDLSEKPEIVDKVYYRGRLSDSNKSFEIVFKDISAVWFKDDVSYGRVNYTLGEVFLNFFQNYVDAWNAAPFGRYYFNTVFVAIVTTVLEIIFAAMAAFAFAKMEFFGKKFIFSLFLATMMVPGEVLLVPNFITLTNLGWIDTYYALIVPWVVSVFAIFLLRQHFMTIPDELYDAAKIDGMNKWKFLWGVMVPLSKPAIITGALLKFVGSWNSFLWVLIITKSPEYRTLPVGLQNFSSATGTEYNLLMSAATFSIIPVVVLFLVTQKYFIAGISRSGLK